MRIIKSQFTFEQCPDPDYIMDRLERAARTCYKSEDKMTPETTAQIIQRIIRNDHTSVLEHAIISVRIICDRGVSHELVRHRLASYSQESTRYCNYADEKFGRQITFVLPSWVVNDEICSVDTSEKYAAWLKAIKATEDAYFEMLDCGASPQEARAVLPNSLKTEVVMTANLREWRHIFKLRCAVAAHPDMRALMIPMLRAFNEYMPLIFKDIVEHFSLYE